MLIVLIAAPLAIVIIGPIGIWIGSAISALVYTIHGYLGWLSVAIMGALWPLLVMTGMHRVFTPTIIQTIAETGKRRHGDAVRNRRQLVVRWFIAGSGMENQNPELRQTALAAAASAIMAGISRTCAVWRSDPPETTTDCESYQRFYLRCRAGMAGLAKPLHGSSRSCSPASSFSIRPIR